MLFFFFFFKVLFWRFDFNLHAQICTQLACNWASRWMAVRSVVAHPVVLSPSSSPVMPFFLHWTQVYPNSRKDFGINRITIALLTSLYLGLNFSTHLSDEFCLTARESLALILRGGGKRKHPLWASVSCVPIGSKDLCTLCLWANATWTCQNYALGCKAKRHMESNYWL